MLRKLSSSVVSILMLMLPVMASANGFGINATRLIYPANAESISVSLRNTMQTLPYLVQSRVSRSADGVTSAPFQVRPPLFRLEPASTNQVRIVAIESNLPEDRESVFYFLATAIPASTAPKYDSQQRLVGGTTQFGIGNTIKIFYRPSNLSGTSSDAQRGLQISRVSGGIEISNPSPYFVSFASIQVDGHALKLDSSEALMLAPFGKHIYPLSSVQGKVHWKTINDEGGLMRLPMIYPRALANVVLPGLLSLWIPATQAVQLNFSAVLSPSTCTFSLSEGTVSLGTLSVSSLQPATLVGARPFALKVTNCSGIEETLAPVVNVTGDGITQDGRWLFRSADSVASNVGVMLVNSSVMPDYSRPEVKNGDNLPLTVQAGRPTDQNITFYAGATCGGIAGCANAGMGTILARVTFSMDYR